MTITVSATGATATKTVTYDRTTPTVTASVGGTNTSRTVSATDNDSDTTTMKYKVITSGTTCGATAMGSGTTAYTEGNSVTIAAEHNGKKVCFSSADAAGNTGYGVTAALTISAGSLTPPTVVFSPVNGAYTNTNSTNVTVDFSEAVYSDSACTTALDDTSAGTVSDLRVGNSSGTAIGHAATYSSSTHTITLDPTSNLADGTVYVGLTNGWYYDEGGTCTQGSAANASFTVDTAGPTVTIDAVSGGYVNATEDDGSVPLRASVSADTVSVSFSISDGETTPDTVTKTGASTLVYAEKLSQTIGGTALASGDYFGSSVSRDGDILAVGAYADDDGGSNSGSVYLITDHDDDGDFADSGATNTEKLSDSTSGISLDIPAGALFGISVHLSGDMLAVGAYGADSNKGRVYLIRDHDSDGSFTDTGTVIEDIDATDISTLSTHSLAGGDLFGTSVHLSGNVLYVGGRGEDSSKGSVYIITDHDNDNSFTDTGTTIAEIDAAKLTSLDSSVVLGTYSYFGSGIATTGDLLIVSAYRADSTKGALYLLTDADDDGDFTDSGTTIEVFDSSDMSTLSGYTLENSDFFGFDVSAHGSMIAVGVERDDDGASNAGAVYLIKDHDSDWSFTDSGTVVEKISVNAGTNTLDASDYFGAGVSLGADGLAIGARGDDDGVSGSGAVYRYAGGGFAATLLTGDFEKDSTPTSGDNKLAEGTITVTATATDSAGNTGTGTKTFVYDQTPPTATITGAPSGTSDTVSLDVTVGGTGVTHYTHKIPTGSDCSTGTYGTRAAVATKITDNISLTADGQLTLCVRGEDAAGNIQGTATSTSWTKDTSGGPSNTLLYGAPTGTSNTETLSISVADIASITHYKHKIVTGLVCSSVDFSTITEVARTTPITDSIASFADGSISICVISKNSSNQWQTTPTRYSWTKDTTGPTVTANATKYYGEAAFTNELSGSYTNAKDIYTKLVFNEAVGKTTGDGSSARPELFYRIGTTDTQYDIIASGSPASGDCVESGTGDADGKQYTCRYTVAATDNGAFAVKVGTGTADATGNNIASAYTHGTTLRLDNTAPTIASVNVSGTNLIVTMSEPVYADTSPIAGDFSIVGGNAPTVNSVSGVAGSASTADNSFTLALSRAPTGTPTLSYTANSNRLVKDAVGKSLATATVISISSVANAPDAPNLALKTPSSSPGNDSTPTITVTVDSTQQNGTVQLYSDSSCSTSISSSVTVDAATEDVDTNTLTEGTRYIIYAKHTGSSTLSTCSTVGVVYQYDGTAPGATVLPVSGGYVDGTEDDGNVTIAAAVDPDTASVSFSISDGTGDTPVTKTGAGTHYPGDKLSDAMSTLSLADSDYFGGAVSRDGTMIAVGAYGDDTGGTSRGTVYLITDSDNDGDFSDAVANDIVEINSSTTGLTLADSDYFGRGVALDGDTLAVGAYGTGAGAVYLIDDGGDSWASIEAGDITTIDTNTNGISLTSLDYFGFSVAL